MSFLNFIFLPLSISAQIEPCYVRCKDNYLNGLSEQLAESSSEFSLELVTPLEILLNQRVPGKLPKRIRMICRDEYGREMTSRCRYYGKMLHNEMQGIVQGGVEHIDSGIDGLCKIVYDYDLCFAKQNSHFCGDTANLFLMKLTYRTTGTLLEMLAGVMKNKTLPHFCQMLWFNQNEGGDLTEPHHNSLRKLRNRVVPSFNLIFTLIWTIFILLSAT
ncbi:hypothetical protein WR25_17137 [Diploscapter pachys]|uniref:Uncharacterized protein n=1 Tax=Diploscapter pachys TaxID=2018661 RepID=A0A2A2JGY2_9BILA|nr:hypothetical protein WR25_17137 [Diploscapter pachys]